MPSRWLLRRRGQVNATQAGAGTERNLCPPWGDEWALVRTAPACEAITRAVGTATLQPVEKPCAVRRLAAVETGPLRAQVARLSETVWNRASDVRENDFPCFAHVRHIVFRFPVDGDRGRCYVKPGWNLWACWLLPIMAQASSCYGYADPVYPKAMLARLAAGHGIDLHGLRPHGPFCPQDPRTAHDQSPGDADGRRRGLPSASRLRLGGQQPSPSRRLQRRRAGPRPLHLRGVRGRGPGMTGAGGRPRLAQKRVDEIRQRIPQKRAPYRRCQYMPRHLDEARTAFAWWPRRGRLSVAQGNGMKERP